MLFGFFFFPHSLSTIPAVFHLGAPQCLAIPTPSPPLAGNPCRIMAGTCVQQVFSALLAIINSSRWLLAFVLGYDRMSLAFVAALSKYYPSQLRSKSTSIPVLEHPCSENDIKAPHFFDPT